MSLWRRTRSEVAGAWRSLRYDMGRRDMSRRPADPPAPPPPVLDVTSTGMSTFGGPVGDLTGGYDEDLPRRPRRLVAVSAFAVLALTGGVGSYFAVVHGLGPALAGEQSPAQADAPPDPLTAATDPVRNEGMGRGTPVRAAAAGAGHAAIAAASPEAARSAPATAPAVRRTPPATHPATECGCLTPPVPTPTGPTAPSGSPRPTPSATATPSPSASASATSSSSPTASASSSAGAVTSESLQRRRRHPRGY